MRAAILLLAFSLAVAAHADTTCPTAAPQSGAFLADLKCGSSLTCSAGTAATLTVQPHIWPFEPPFPPYSVQSCDQITWNFGDGTPAVTLTGVATTTHTWAQRGVYDLSVTVTNALGTATARNIAVITDDPPAYVNFSANSYAVPETAGSVAIMLLRTGNTSVTSTLQWRIPCFDCGGAVSPHLRPGGGTVTFAPGESTKTITLPIFNDGAYTGTTNDTIGIQASDGTVIGSDAISWLAYIVVNDDEPQPSASIDDVTVLRSRGSARFTVHLSAPMGLDTPFALLPTDETAVNGVDYQLRPGALLVMPAGATTASIDVPIVNDGVPHLDKLFSLQISPTLLWPPSIGRGSATCTIVNDNFFVPSSLALATGAHATLVVDSVLPFALDTVVPITTSDPSVIAVAPSVTFQGGNARTSVDVMALQAGNASVNVAIRGVAGHARVAVSDPIAIVAQPAALQLRAGDDATVTLSMSPPAAVTKFLSIAGTATLIEVPSSVAIPPGGSAGISVHALRGGGGAIIVTDPSSGASTSIAVDVASANAPLVTAVVPNVGSTVGGTHVTLAGSHFDGPCAVSFGTAAGTVVDAHGDALSVITPAHAEGAVDIVVTCGSDQVTLPHAFTYARGRRRTAS